MLGIGKWKRESVTYQVFLFVLLKTKVHYIRFKWFHLAQECRRNLIQQVLTLAIHQAKTSVRITTPYFVPSDNLIQVIKMTAQRGVTVELLLPKKNDSLLVNWASKSFL